MKHLRPIGFALLTVISFLLIITFSQNIEAQESREVGPAAATKYYKTGSQLRKVSQWGKYGKAAGKIYGASGLTIAQDGTIMLGQSFGMDDFTRVHKFTPEGKFIDWFGGTHSGEGPDNSLISTHSLVVMPDFTLFVLQGLRIEAKQFDFEGNKLQQWPLDKTWFASPQKGCCDSEGNIYYSDYANKLFHKYDYDGKNIWTLDGKKTAQNFRELVDAACSRDDKIFCVDTRNMQVVIFDDSGKEIGTISKFGHKPAEFNGISNITIGPSGVIYVLERKKFYTNKIETYHIYLKRYLQDGTFLGRIRVAGEASDEYLKNTIQDIAAAPDGSLYLAESNADKKFGRVIRYLPAYYKPQGKTGRIVGKIKGVNSDEMKYMTVMIEGVQDGVPFFATVRPKANGKYKITKFPIGVDFTIRLLGYNTMKYECDELLGTGDKVVKKQDLKVVKK